MSSILLGSDRPQYSAYGTNEKEAILLFTFFFVLFFFQFGRSILLNQEVVPYHVIVMTILIMVWYGGSLALS